jgi:hypothetical protein
LHESHTLRRRGYSGYRYFDLVTFLTGKLKKESANFGIVARGLTSIGMSRPRKRSIGGSTGLPSFTHHTNGSTGNHHRWGSFTQVEEGERSRMRQVLGIKPLEHAGYVTRTLGVVMIVLVFFFMVTSFLFSKRPHYSVPGYEPTVYTTDPVMLPSRDELILWQKGSSDPNGYVC